MAFDPGVSMPWGECVRLFAVLREEPGSRVFAALAGWDYPLSREAIDTRSLLEVYLRSHHDKKRGRFKPLDWPWPDRSKSRPRPTVSPEVAIAALRQAGHTAALPSRFRHLDTQRNGARSRDECGRFTKKEVARG